MTATLPFALFYAGDAYSTSNRIMGRQAAGKALMKGVVRTWPNAELRGLFTREKASEAMARQLRDDGFGGRIDVGVLPDWRVAVEAGTLYYPAPPAKDFAAARNQFNPHAFSLMGVTHTLSSAGAMDQLADLILPPFQPWDALICTSKAAYDLVSSVHDDMRAYWRESVGATRFVDVEKPIIPLGVDVPAFAPSTAHREGARAALGLREEETAFLFAGRLAFHAKANPVPVYQALEKLAADTPVVCIEAGVFPGDNIRKAYQTAQKVLAPSVRFLWIDGDDSDRYRKAWQGADVFVSLSDNIQETFGLTPVEAMAAGLPVVVSDWSGYRDTVRDGVDGFRIPTLIAPAGAGEELALRHALGIDSYDRYIGQTSLATAVDPQALTQALRRLASDPELRKSMGAAGQARAAAAFDWPVILRRYAETAEHLNEIRSCSLHQSSRAWPQRADPFRRFAHFASAVLDGSCSVRAKPGASLRLPELMSLTVTNFAFSSCTFSQEAPAILLDCLNQSGEYTVASLLAQTGMANQVGHKALMWLWKFDLVSIDSGGLVAPVMAVDNRL